MHNIPDQQDPDTDPYGLAVKDGTFYVADAAGSDIVKVVDGDTSLVEVLSTDSQPVPTSVAWVAPPRRAGDDDRAGWLRHPRVRRSCTRCGP